MKKWQFWLGIAISAVFLYFSFRKLPLESFWESIKTANYWWVFPGIAVYFVGVWARAWRWHYLLKPIKKIKTSVMFPVTCIGYMGNNIYPARAGEVLRAVVLKRKEGVPISASLATIIVEKVFDSVVMLAFVFVNLPELAKVANFESGFAGNIQQLAFIGMGVFLGALLVFLLAAMFPKRTEIMCLWLINRLIPLRFREKTTGITLKFLEGLVSLRSPANVLMVFLTSVIIWLLETVKYWFVMHAFPFTVSFFALMLSNGLANLVSIIPAAPGYFGTFEAVTKAVLVAYGVDPAAALGYAVVLHMALWLPITLLGAYYMTREGIKWSDSMRKETESAEPQAG